MSDARQRVSHLRRYDIRPLVGHATLAYRRDCRLIAVVPAGPLAGREALQRYCGHHAVFQAFERGIAHSGCDFLIFTRLVPLFPYNLQNYAYGLTAIPFWSFTFISTIATLPGLFIYTFMASELARDGITLAFIGKLSIAGLMLFVLTQAARRYGRYKRISVATSAVSDKNG